MANVSYEPSYPLLLFRADLFIPPVITRSSTIGGVGGDQMSAGLGHDQLPTENLMARSPKKHHKHHQCHDDGNNPVPCSDPNSTESEDKASQDSDNDANAANGHIW